MSTLLSLLKELRIDMLSIHPFELNRVVDHIIDQDFISELVRMIDFRIDIPPILIEVTWILIIILAKDRDWSSLACKHELLKKYQMLLQIPSELLVEQVKS